MDNDHKQSIVYSPATGRIAESDGFRWTYLPGTNLKSSLTYRTNDVVTWSYEPHRDLLTAVTNATYSTYVYTNDLLGRRTSKNNEQYSYNVRDELIAADNVSYNYDDIGIYAPTSVSEVGNRITAEGKTYTANNLNQYTAIDDFTPQYDADGNQTLIKTSTGIWSVVYNAENRPIRWQSGDTVITMSFDRMGRRIEMRIQSAASDLLQRFVYDNYLCIQQLRPLSNALFHSYVWDPTEPIATRPLIFLPSSGVLSYYFHDGNKNVSDLIPNPEPPIHYSYTPFGTPTSTIPSENPFCFSSEFYDTPLGLIYYNYRHYHSQNGRWVERDPQEEMERFGAYTFCNNKIIEFDYLGRVLPIVATPIMPTNPPIVVDELGNITTHPSPASSSDDVLECVHITLDLLGTLEPTPVCDTVNALIYSSEGKFSEMGVSLCGIIPYLGDIGKGGKYVCKVVKKTPNHVANQYVDYIVKKYGMNTSQRQQFRRYLENEKRARGMHGDAISKEELEELAQEFLGL